MLRIALIVLAIFTFKIDAVHADQEVAAIGGIGGGAYRARCPDGMALRGLDLRAGDDIDQITAVCARLISSTQLDSNLIRTQSFGGNGGSPRSLICGNNEPYVSGIEISAVGDQTIVVYGIKVWCNRFQDVNSNHMPPSMTFIAAPHSSRAPIEGKLTCGLNKVLVGIHGRSGAMVDAIGAICDEPRFPTRPSITINRPTSNTVKVQRP